MKQCRVVMSKWAFGKKKKKRGGGGGKKEEEDICRRGSSYKY